MKTAVLSLLISMGAFAVYADAPKQVVTGVSPTAGARDAYIQTQRPMSPNQWIVSTTIQRPNPRTDSKK